MKNKKVLSLVTIILLVVMILIPTFVMASGPLENADAYRPSGTIGTKAAQKAGNILNVITVIGIVVGVITLIVIGIKYMVGTVQEKAEYKKTMFSYIIGLVLLISVCSFVQIIYNLTTDITSEIVEPSQMTGGGGQSSGHGAGRRTTTAPGD
jgi:TrbC/VIRB2 family.